MSQSKAATDKTEDEEKEALHHVSFGDIKESVEEKKEGALAPDEGLG